MSREERLQEILRAFAETLHEWAEGRHSREVHAATIGRLLAEVRQLKAEDAEVEAMKAVGSLSA